jgi:hypothetical protein
LKKNKPAPYKTFPRKLLKESKDKKKKKIGLFEIIPLRPRAAFFSFLKIFC